MNKDQIIKILESKHPECFYKPTTFKVDKEIIADQLVSLFKTYIKEIVPKKKDSPKPIKQEIWGGESGLENTTIVSPDVFGEKYVSGYNQALSDLLSKLE